jgi:hypothetical protein
MKMMKKAGRIRIRILQFGKTSNDTDDPVRIFQPLFSFLREPGKQGKNSPEEPVHTKEYDGCHERSAGIIQKQGTDDHRENTLQEDKPKGKEANIRGRLLRSNRWFNQADHYEKLGKFDEFAIISI